MADRTWLLNLSTEDCVEHLRRNVIGRLGVVVDGKPEVFPVGYLFHEGHVCFATTDGTKLHAALTWPWVGFEIDGLAADASEAWSVMVSGRAEEITDPDAIGRIAGLVPVAFRDPDAQGIRWVRIVPSAITGRLITRTAADAPLTITLDDPGASAAEPAGS